MKKTWLQRFIYPAVFLPIALLWGELFTHMLLPQNVDNIVNIFKTDPVTGYIYQKNAQALERGREYSVAYRTNSFGLRDREYDINKKGVFRVLFFGDSFSESHGVNLEESLPKQVERYLKKGLDESGKQLQPEVVNVSIGGYSPYHYWKSYRRWKSLFKPQMVFVGFYMGNDYVCEDETIRYVVEDGEIVGTYNAGESEQVKRKNPLRTMRKWLATHSELYVLMRNFFYYNEIIDFFTKQEKARESTTQVKPYLVPEPETVHAERDKCFGYLKKLRDEAALDGVPVALMTIPVKFEIDPGYLEQIMLTQDLARDSIDLEQPYNELADFCRSEGIYFFDPRAALQKQQTDISSCYFQYDGHWNAKGIEHAARSVVAQWKNLRLAPFN